MVYFFVLSVYNSILYKFDNYFFVSFLKQFLCSWIYSIIAYYFDKLCVHWSRPLLLLFPNIIFPNIFGSNNVTLTKLIFHKYQKLNRTAIRNDSLHLKMYSFKHILTRMIILFSRKPRKRKIFHQDSLLALSCQYKFSTNRLQMCWLPNWNCLKIFHKIENITKTVRSKIVIATSKNIYNALQNPKCNIIRGVLFKVRKLLSAFGITGSVAIFEII